MHSPEAFFDTLTIVGELEDPFGGVTRLEVQRGSYLACLLALYEGRPLADWGHRFARTDFGTPFSAGVNDALETLANAGHLDEDGGRYRLGGTGRHLRKTLFEMSYLTSRRRYLDAACGSALLVPPATLSEGLDNEPTVRRTLQREKGGGLLEGPALALLYEQFTTLTKVFECNSDDLLAPSVVWLSFIADQPVSSQYQGVVK